MKVKGSNLVIEELQNFFTNSPEDLFLRTYLIFVLLNECTHNAEK